MLLDSKVRECDLLQSQMLLREARPCWESARTMFPSNVLVLNELGNVLSQVFNPLALYSCWDKNPPYVLGLFTGCYADIDFHLLSMNYSVSS